MKRQLTILPAVALACACAAAPVTPTEAQKSQSNDTARSETAMTTTANAPQPRLSLDELNAQSRRYAPVEFKVDLAHLSDGDRAALVPLIKASRVLDRIFERQMWAGNAALRARLEAAAKVSPDRGAAELTAFEINRGPWSELDGYTAFLDGVPERKPRGAAYYPEGMTPERLEAWFASLAADEAAMARGFYSLIEATEGGSLRAVPYSAAYRTELEEAAGHLRRAAELADDASLKRFLAERAEAFLSDDYRPSEVAWMELDGDIDLTIGPYETYLDEAMGLKAAFEAYLGLRDRAESERLKVITRHLGEIETSLPMPDEYKRRDLGALAPIAVLNQLFNAGDAAHGVQAAAFNLPNDEVVVAQKGSKRVMLKNVQQAKFAAILTPIADRLLALDARAHVDFDAFFLHILAHELSHGLGPQMIQVAGGQTSVRQSLGETYSAIEEAKADLMGLFMVQHFIDHGERLGLKALLPENAEAKLYATYLASSFRTLRFGIEEAHARSMAAQFNAFVQAGAYALQADGRFTVDAAKMKSAVRALLGEVLIIQAKGDRQAAEALLKERAVLTDEMQEALGKLGGIAVDIRPVFTTAEAIEAAAAEASAPKAP